MLRYTNTITKNKCIIRPLGSAVPGGSTLYTTNCHPAEKQIRRKIIGSSQDHGLRTRNKSFWICHPISLGFNLLNWDFHKNLCIVYAATLLNRSRSLPARLKATGIQ
jgi:hypothetical protein